MNRERFQALAAAYGGAISRWPLAERGAAKRFAFWRRRSTRNILRDARGLDQILHRSPNPALRPEIRGSLIEESRFLRELGAERRSWFGAILGAGLATACAAGIGAGFVIAPLTTTDSLTSPMDPAEVAASALGNPAEFGDG
jgi:hypothetical protein